MLSKEKVLEKEVGLYSKVEELAPKIIAYERKIFPADIGRHELRRRAVEMHQIPVSDGQVLRTFVIVV